MLRLRLPALPASVPAARRAVQGRGELPHAVECDVVLVVSELVTNAVRHAGLRADDDVELRVEYLPAGVRVSVRDGGRGFERPAADAFPPPWQPGGRGLQIVQRLARRWDVDRGTGTVWAELDT